MASSPPYTTSTALLDALVEAGVEYIFANLGSDHPGLVEAIAAARATGRPVPAVVTCPNEMVGMSAAHGHAQVSGRPQAVLVHVECGTQALAGAVHNAARGRVPMLVLETALPAKFEDAIIEALGHKPDRPVDLVGLEDLPQRFEVMEADTAAIKRFIVNHTS